MSWIHNLHVAMERIGDHIELNAAIFPIREHFTNQRSTICDSLPVDLFFCNYWHAQTLTNCVAPDLSCRPDMPNLRIVPLSQNPLHCIPSRLTIFSRLYNAFSWTSNKMLILPAEIAFGQLVTGKLRRVVGKAWWQNVYGQQVNCLE